MHAYIHVRTLKNTYKIKVRRRGSKLCPESSDIVREGSRVQSKFQPGQVSEQRAGDLNENEGPQNEDHWHQQLCHYGDVVAERVVESFQEHGHKLLQPQCETCMTTYGRRLMFEDNYCIVKGNNLQ